MWPTAVPPGVSRWQSAASFAAARHRHQMRKDGVTPYYAHVVRVSMTVAQVFGCRDDAAITAALLHDTIEDTTTDYDDIMDRFGAEVADIVAALTKNMALPEVAREAEYDARLARADWRARLIKLADTYDNYCDVATFPEAARPEQRAKAREKAERALALAAPDLDRPETAAACRALRALLAG